MKFRRETNTNPEKDSGREMREMAEAMSLYRSAMHHIAQKHAAAPFAAPERLAAEAKKRARAHRTRLVLVPALGAALAAAVIGPAVGHLHHEKATIARVVVEPAPVTTVAAVDDTELMNQIDSDLTQDVPDALAPLADLSSQSGSTNQRTEKTNARQK
jgi:hypothetical protein